MENSRLFQAMAERLFRAAGVDQPDGVFHKKLYLRICLNGRKIKAVHKNDQRRMLL